jgi:Holliday junction resolvasome RuvABC endonuclease subunit
VTDRVILGIDPSPKSSGFAIIKGDEILWSAQGPTETYMAEIFYDALDEHQPEIAAIEAPWLFHIQSSLKVACSCGYWEGICGLYGVPVVRVLPSVWRSVFYGANKKRKECKALSIIWASRIFDKPMPEDQAEAALVARYLHVTARKA